MKFRLPVAPRNVVIRLPNWVGDILMTRRAVQGFRGLWPGARFIGMVRLQHQQLVKRFDLFDDLLCAPEGAGLSRAISVRSAAAELRASYETAREAGVRLVSFYNYGIMPRRNLHWIRQVVSTS